MGDSSIEAGMERVRGALRDVDASLSMERKAREAGDNRLADSLVETAACEAEVMYLMLRAWARSLGSRVYLNPQSTNPADAPKPKTEVNISLGKAKIEGTPAEVGRAIRDAIAQAAPEPKPGPVALADDALCACLRATQHAANNSDGSTSLAMSQAAQALAEVRSKL